MPTPYLLHLISDNPYNERPLDEDNVAGLAASIETDDLLQPPLARPHPTRDGEIELAFGHHRLAAFRRLSAKFEAAHAGQPNPYAAMPLEVRPIDNPTMARYALIENHRRKDPSAIETARALVRFTTEFGLTQEAAGAIVGLKTQGAVANIIGLLELPADVQDLVDRRQLAQGPARSLIPLVKWNAQEVSRIAQKAVNQKDHEPARALEWLIDSAVRDLPHLNHSRQTGWPLDWPGKKAALTADIGDGQGDEIRACAGCPFNYKHDGAPRCLRPACHTAKAKLWAQHAAEHHRQRLGLQPLAEGETPIIIYSGGYASQARAQALVRSKAKHLRLVPAKPGTWGAEDVTGSDSLALATVDPAAAARFHGRATAPPSKTTAETPAQAERRRVAEEELKQERYAERCTFNRARVDILWALETASAYIAEHTTGGGALLALALDAVAGDHQLNGHCPELLSLAQTLARAAQASYEGGYFPRCKARAPHAPELDLPRRQVLAYVVIARHLGGQGGQWDKASEVYASLPRAAGKIAKAAEQHFAVALPEGWAAPPVHRTPANCWHCGAFSSRSADQGFTQAEMKAGWRQVHQGKQLAGVFCCDDHAKAGPAQVAQPKRGRGRPKKAK